MKRGRRLLWAGALCAALTGCSAPAALPYTHDIETTVLIRTLGVDVGTQSLDGVGVTASSGARPSNESTPPQEAVVLSAQADTVSAARAAMQTYGDNELFFGTVEQMLVGEGLAQRGVDDFLTLLTRDFELRLDAQLWVVKGSSAADVLLPAQEEEGADQRLEAMEDDIKLSGATLPRSGREALVDLRRNGATFLPALQKSPSRPGDGGKGETTILTAGYALLRDGALCGWTTLEESHGINLLVGQLDNEPVELTAPDSSKLAVSITRAQTSYTSRLDEDNNLIGLRVECQVEARVGEVRGGGVPQGEELDWVETALAQRCQARMEEALEHAQALQTDFFNLGRRSVMRAPWQKQAVERQWEDAFSALEITVNAEARVVRG